MNDIKDKSIQNSLESGSFKNAHQIVLKQLKRNPNSSYYYALECLVLTKLKKLQECETSALDLLSKTPSDVNTLTLLYDIFKSLGRPEKCLEVWERAIKKYPTSELCTKWFYKCLDEWDLCGLQKASMQLSKYSDQRIVKMWQCMCILIELNLDAGCSPQQRLLFPKLGFRMISNLKPLQNSQEMYLYCKFGALTNSYDEILEEMEHFLSKEQDLQILLLYIDYLFESGKFPLLFEKCTSFLKDGMDDWFVWCRAIDAAKRVGEGEKMWSFIESYPVSRNQCLARLEYCKVFEEDNGPSVSKYLERFSNKPCCSADLMVYLSEPVELPEQNDLNGCVNGQKLKLLDKSLDKDKFSQENIELYLKYAPLVKEKLSTDYFIGDELLIMVIEGMLQPTQASVFRAILILEKLVESDRHEYHLRLLLTRMYLWLNCPSVAFYHFQSLSTKFVQLDTLSHYYTTRISTIYPETGFLEKVASVYKNNDVETKYLVEMAFEDGVFQKLEGFLEFGIRMENSITQQLNLLELNNCRKALGRKTQFDFTKLNHLIVGDAPEKGILNSLCDNRDFEVGKSPKIYDMLPIGPKQDEQYVILKGLVELIANETDHTCLRKWISVARSVSTDSFTETESTHVSVVLDLAECLLSKQSPDGVCKAIEQVPLSVDSVFHWECNHKLMETFYMLRNIKKMALNFNRKDILSLVASKLNHLKSVADNLSRDTKWADVTDDNLLKKLDISQTFIDEMLQRAIDSNTKSISLLKNIF